MNVRTIRNKGGLTLVEWTDRNNRLRRNWVATDKVEITPDGTERVPDPAHGVPYGIDFARLLPNLKTTPETVDQTLKHVGLWTAEDIYANPAAAQGALIAAYGLDFAALLDAVKAYEDSLVKPTTPARQEEQEESKT